MTSAGLQMRRYGGLVWPTRRSQVTNQDSGLPLTVAFHAIAIAQCTDVHRGTPENPRCREVTRRYKGRLSGISFPHLQDVQLKLCQLEFQHSQPPFQHCQLEFQHSSSIEGQQAEQRDSRNATRFG